MYIKVRVTAGAKKEQLTKKKSDHFDVWVKEEAKMNMANRRVIELIAQEFNIEKKLIRIISGHHSASKILSLPD